jgi:hypothetical protein
MRPKHLTVGWTWRADVDGEPAVWGICGHVTDAVARSCVEGYEGEAVGVLSISRDYRRNVPCRSEYCAAAGDCSGMHMEWASGPGRGASPYTWVECDE